MAVAHAEAERSAAAYLALLAKVNDDIQQTTTIDEFIAVAGNAELQRLNQEFNAQCSPLQLAANNNGAHVDLACTD